MTVRIGNTETPGRRHPRGEDGEQAVERRRANLISAYRRQRSGWWYHLEFALLRSR
ncbi:hypothetical protein [Amycolatopsis rhizosphaerae]|uniref:hypothetical protein n=1 Tax=Amycolatopsis rhizosphaerae TaxID=2053003 RepID=UPI001643C85A|nr:hypothetical protein [Amycolatopsis rhizosphaerae]